MPAAKGSARTPLGPIVCKAGKFRKVVKIGAGDSYSCKTQAGKRYVPNTRCVVTYKVGIIFV